MHIYPTYTSSDIAILNDPSGPFFKKDGSLDFSLLHTFLQSPFENNYSYYLAAFYYMTTVDVSTSEGIQFVWSAWNAIKMHQPNTFWNNVEKLHDYGIDVKSRILWMLQNNPSTTIDFPLVRIGLYFLSYEKSNVAHQEYFGDIQVLKDTPRNILLKTLYSHDEHISLETIFEKINNDSWVKSLIAEACFGKLFLTSIDRHYDVESAMRIGLPMLDACGLSLKSVLAQLRIYTKGKRFIPDVMDWLEQHRLDLDPAVQKACAEIDSFLKIELTKALKQKHAWNWGDVGWAKYCSTMSITHPDYQHSRPRIAEALYDCITSKRTVIESIDVFRIALNSGEHTFKTLLGLYKDNNVLEDQLACLLQSDSNQLISILKNPIFEKSLNMSAMFTLYYDFSKRHTEAYKDSKKYYIDLYGMYSNKTRVDEYRQNSMFRTLILGIRDIHALSKIVYPSSSLKDILPESLFIDLYVGLGARIFLSLQTNSEWSSSTGFQSIKPFLGNNMHQHSIPIAIQLLICLDPEFIENHRAEVRRLVIDQNKQTIIDIYSSWLKEWFGPLYNDPTLTDFAIKDGQSLMTHLRSCFIGARPEYTKSQAPIEIGDLLL